MSRDEPVLVVAGHPPEVFPGSGLPLPVPVPLPTRREALRAAAAVAVFVGVPALAAAGAVLALFALSAAVLAAPFVAGALIWAAWHYNRVPARRPPAGGDARAHATRAPAPDVRDDRS